MLRSLGYFSLLVLQLLGQIPSGATSLQGQENCPRPDEIAPCQCRTRGPSIQVRCTNSMMTRITEAMTNIRKRVESVDVLILEDNTIPDLPSRAFGSVKVNRLFIENNRLVSIDRNAFAGIEDFITELYIKEPSLKSFPLESVDYLRKLEVFSIENSKIIEFPRIAGLQNLKLFKLDGSNVRNLNSHSLKNLPSLKYLHVSRSNVRRIEVGLLESLPSLALANFSDNAITWIHPRAFSYSAYLTEINLKGNAIRDAGMIGRAIRSVTSLEHVDISHNLLTEIKEGSFSDISQLKYIDLSFNSLFNLERRSFLNLRSLNTIDLSRNRIESFNSHAVEDSFQIEKLFLKHNKIRSLSDISFLIDSLPNLRYLDLSENEIREIPYGVLRGYPKLERLFLSGNQISRVSSEGLSDMPSLNELDLSHNKLVGDLIDAPIFNLQNLKILKISNNKLSKINDQILENLPLLRRLDISHNGISLIESEAFRGIPQLDYLNASHNRIKELDSGLFKDMRELFELDFSYNEFTSLPPNLLEFQRRLEYVSFAHNQIQVLSSSLLPLDNRIRHLDINSNFIKEFPDDLISKLKNIKTLLFIRNSVRQLTSGSFSQLVKLESIQLHDNRIESIDDEAFRDLSSLKNLDLSLNIIRTVGNALSPLSGLMKLNLSDNYITTLPHKTFTSLKRLSTLDISNNTVSEIQEAFRDMPSLKYLDLSYNHLPIIHTATFSDLPNLLSLKLDHNSILHIDPGAFDRLWTLERLSFTKNGLQNIQSGTFTDLPSLETLHLNDNLIKTLEDDSFQDLYSLKKLHLDQNLIERINEKAFRRVPSIRFLNMSLNLIQELPLSGFLGLETLETIDLSFNDIRKIDDGTFENMKWLTRLLLNDNNVCKVGKNVFTGAKSLSKLDLKNNRLSRVDGDSFSNIKEQITWLRIAGNPLTCDCNTLWLRNWITEGSVVQDHPRCYFPKSLSGSELKVLRTSRFKCERSQGEDFILEDACLGVPLKIPSQQAVDENVDLIISSTPSTQEPPQSQPDVPESPDVEDEKEDVKYEYYYVYYDEDGNLLNKSEQVQPVSKPLISKVQDIQLNLESDDSKPGDTPTIYAGVNKQGALLENSSPSSEVSSTTEGFSIFGFSLPSLPKLPPVSLSFDLKPSQLGNSFLLPVGRKGDATKEAKNKEVDHTRGPDDLPNPIWVDTLSRYKKEIKDTPRKRPGLSYSGPPNPVIPLSPDSFHILSKSPSLKFEIPERQSDDLVRKSFHQTIEAPFSFFSKTPEDEPMSFAASEGINGFRPLFRPNSVDPIFSMSSPSTTTMSPVFFKFTPSLKTNNPIYESTTAPPASSPPNPTINHKTILSQPSSTDEMFRNSQWTIEHETPIIKETSSSSTTTIPTTTTTVSSTTTSFTPSTTTPRPSRAPQSTSTVKSTTQSTTSTTSIAPSTSNITVEYEYYYEYYEDEQDGGAVNSSTTSTTTSSTTTSQYPPITSTIVSYVDGRHNLDNKKSLASVETRNGVLSRSRGIPVVLSTEGSVSSTTTPPTTSYPFHPDTFDPTARLPLNPEDPETEAINWYFNGEDRKPFVDPKLVRQSATSGQKAPYHSALQIALLWTLILLL